MSGIFDKIEKMSPDNLSDITTNGWKPFIEQNKIADETLKKFLNDANQTDKSLEAFKQYPDVVKKTGKAFNYAALGAKALTVAMNVVVFFAITKTIEGAAWVVDQWVNRVEIAKEAVADAKSNFDSLRSELQSINEELETNKDRINELNELPSLTYVEEGELDKLERATKELERQRDIKNVELKRAAEDLSESNRNAFDKEYGDNNFSYSDVMGLDSEYASLSMSPTSDVALAQEGLEGLAAAIVKVQEAQKQAQESGDSEWLDSLTEREKYYRGQLEDNLSTLQGYRDNLTDILNYRDLTDDEQSFYDNLEQGIRLIYQFTDPSSWNQIEFDQIFNDDSLDVTKEKLIELAQAGKLDENTIKQYSKLSDAIGQTDFILSDGETDVTSFINQIKALSNESESAGDAVESAFAPLSKQELITNINSMSDGFESLDKIMNSMKGKDPFDYTLLDDKKFKDSFEGMGESYTDFVEKVSSSPKDVNAAQGAFNNLLTTWVDSSGILNGLTEESAGLATTMLQNMGVANAEEFVTSRMAIAQEHLAAQKAYTAEVSNELANATANEIPAILDEATNSDIAKVALAGLVLEKQFFNGNSLNTSGDIENILSLVGVIGTANKALQALNAVKSGKVGAGSKADYDSIVSAAQKEKVKAIAAGTNYKGKGSATNTIYDGGTKTNKSSGSGSKDKADTTKQIDWVKRYLDMLNDERQELVNSASKYSSEYTQQIIALDKQILPETQKAVETYKNAWEDAASKLSKSDRAKVELGYTDIETYSGDNAENIQAAIDSFDKYQDMQKQYAEAEKASNETLLSQYDASIARLENENEALASQNSLIESQIDYYKEIGSIVSASDYATMLDNVGDEIDNVNGKISDLKLKLNLARELYGSNSEEYDDVKDAISDAEDELYSLNKKQAQYNKTLAEMPITNLSTIISMYEDIGSKIENYGKMATATGQKLNADYYQKLISNQSTVLDQYKKQITEIKSLMSEYEKGSDNWQELYDQLQSIDSSMASIVENMAQLNEELLQMPLDGISTLSDSLQKVITGLTSVQDEYDTILSAVNNGIQDRIDLLGEEQEKAADAQQTIINGLQDELDLLQKTNEARERQLAVEQDEYDLAKAQGQRNVATVRNGIVDYENDSDAIRDAQEALANSKEDLAEYNLEQQIDDAKTALDNLNDSYQDQIDSLQEIADKWSEISSIQKGISDANLATSLFGDGWLDKIVSGNDSEIYDTLSSLYQTNAKQLDEYQKQADSTANIQSLIEDYINSYKSGEITYTQALTGINNLLSQMNQSMSAMDNLQNIYDYLGTVNGVGADADSIFKGIQSGLATTADELVKSLEQYNENAGTISEYTSSWQQLTDNVASMLDVLKDVRDNLKDSEDNSDDDDDDNDNTRYGGGKDGSPGTPGKGEYVNSGPGVSRKDGITRGLIGSTSDSDREASMKLLGLKKLDPDEIPAVLHMGEAVFNSDQQQKLLENFGTAWNYKPSVPDYSSLLSNVNVTNKTETPMITLNGGINIQKSDTPDELAKGIMDGKLGLALGQRLGKR